eukprot:5063997-Amphidinium_carterae.1
MLVYRCAPPYKVNSDTFVRFILVEEHTHTENAYPSFCLSYLSKALHLPYDWLMRPQLFCTSCWCQAGAPHPLRVEGKGFEKSLS